MSIVFLGLPNITARQSCRITASAGSLEPTAGEAENLKTNEPSQTARLNTVNPLLSYWNINTYGDLFGLDGLALVNHSLSATGYFRLVGASGSLTTSQEYVVINPDSIASSSNISSTTVTNLVGTIGSPNGTYIGPSTTSLPWNLLLNFFQDAKVARQGTAMAAVVVETNRVDNVPPHTAIQPAIKVELWEGGVFIRDLGRKSCSKAGNQIFVFPFNPAELSSPANLANVQVKLYGYNGTIGPDEYVRADTVQIVYDNVAVVPPLDTGWIQASQLFTSDRDGTLPTKSIHHLLGSSLSGVDSMKLMLLDDGAEVNPPVAAIFGSDFANSTYLTALSLFPEGYVEAGMVILGPKLEVTPGIIAGSAQPATSVITVSLGGTSQRGQSYGADSYSMRGVPNALEIHCSRDVMMQLMTRIGWQKGTQGVFYVIMDPDLEMEYQLFSAFPCTCKSITSTPVLGGRTGQTRAEDMFVVRMELEEKL